MAQNNNIENSRELVYGDQRIRLESAINRKERIIFKVTPSLSESTSVAYKTIIPTHMPGEFLPYDHTSARSFSLSGVRLISRTREEAIENLQQVQMLRSWKMPYFGRTTTISNTEKNPQRQNRDTTTAEESANLEKTDENIRKYGIERKGAPPPLLLLSAYSPETRSGGSIYQIHKIPVVMESFNLTYPADIDYIATEFGSIPIIWDLEIGLKEAQSPRALSNFDLFAYKQGKLGGF